MSDIKDLINKYCSNGVEYVKLGNIVKFINGRAYKQAELLNSGKYRVLRVGNFFTSESWYYSDLELDDSKYCNKGDLLYAWAASLGPKIWEEEKTIFHYHIWKLSFDEKIILKRYLFHYLKKDVDDIYSSLTHSTMPHVSMANMKERIIPLPPLQIQEEIVRILDKFTSLTAKLQAKLQAELQARRQQYEYYSSKLFNETNALRVPMSELADFVYGYTEKAKSTGDTRFIRITDINEQGKLKENDAMFINMNDESRKCLLKKGDLIMARTGATFGKTLYFESDFPSVFASFLIKITPDNNRMLSKYYWHFTKTPLYWEQANKLVTTGGQPQFNTPAIKQIKVPIPSLQEQQRIVSILDRFDKLCNDITDGLPAEIEARQKQYEYYRDKLLSFKEKK